MTDLYSDAGIGAAIRALLQPLAQTDRLLRLHTPLGPDVLVAEAMHGWESLDAGGFAFEITALSGDAHLSLEQLLGKPALLELLCADSRTALRPFHGHVTACQLLGANGGLARYRLRLEPWLSFLRLRTDSFVFHDMSVVEIIDHLFEGHRGPGSLVPAWRWELADASVYRQRSACTQYQESDHAFVHRLLAEEGLFYRFEHSAAVGEDALGTHKMVIADSVEAFGDLPGVPVRFHRAEATEREDSITQWHTTRRLGVGRVMRGSWDYRAHQWREVHAETDSAHGLAIDSDPSGPYTWPDFQTGERLARQHAEALQVAQYQVVGGGSWRRLAPGLRFTLVGHHQFSDAEAGSHVCLRVQHVARNNLGDELHASVAQHLGAPKPLLQLPEVLSGLGGSDALVPAEEVDSYRNRFIALPSARPYRPATHDGHGERLHPHPQVHGVQSAIVVGAGAPVHTDRDHRVLVQFPWQRGSQVSSRLEHPRGDDNAPGHAQAGSAQAWVRVVTPVAGPNFGTNFIPRVGQEVLVAFLEGNIDRPVVIGAAYNGRGYEDAQHNEVTNGPAGATGNASAWFSGNGHPAVLSGFKSQALASSDTGDGDFQQLVFDDTPGQARIELSTTRTEAALVMGHLKKQRDNRREDDLGFGLSLHTEAQGALRAGSGLLLSSSRGHQQLSAEVARGQITQGRSLIDSLGQTASAQDAALEGEPDTLPVSESLQGVGEALTSTHGQNDSAGGGSAPAFSEPLLVAESAAGLAALTPASQVWVSGTHTALSAQQDIDWISQGSAVLSAGGGVSVFTHGTATAPQKPNQETGIALHAASGKVSVQAQGNTASVRSKETLTLASHQANATLTAATHLLMTAAGAYFKLDGENIELGAPGAIDFKAARKELTGPMGGTAAPVRLPSGALNSCMQRQQAAAKSGAGLA